MVAGFCDPTNEASGRCLARCGLEERGVRMVRGVNVEGEEGEVLAVRVWTKGVGWGEGVLEELGM